MTRRRPSAAAARRLRGDLAAVAQRDRLPAHLGELLDGFQPRRELGDQWPRLRPVVEEVMTRSRIRTRNSFHKYLTHVGYFLVWAGAQGLPVDPATVVRTHVDEYCRVGMPTSSEKSRADRRARLRWLADQVNPSQAPDRGVPVARPSIKPPYTIAEMAHLVRVASTQPSAEKARQASLCIGLGAGAGLDAPDLRRLRREHITDDASGGLTVHVPGGNPRNVPVMHRYATLVRYGVAGIDPGQLLLGRVEERRNITGHAMAELVTLGDCPRIEQSRLRATWLATLMSQPVPLGVLLNAAGLRSARTLPDLLPYLPTADPCDASQALRGPRDPS